MDFPKRGQVSSAPSDNIAHPVRGTPEGCVFRSPTTPGKHSPPLSSRPRQGVARNGGSPEGATPCRGRIYKAYRRRPGVIGWGRALSDKSDESDESDAQPQPPLPGSCSPASPPSPARVHRLICPQGVQKEADTIMVSRIPVGIPAPSGISNIGIRDFFYRY